MFRETSSNLEFSISNQLQNMRAREREREREGGREKEKCKGLPGRHAIELVEAFLTTRIGYLPSNQLIPRCSIGSGTTSSV